MRISFFFRRSASIHYSIENIFENVIASLPAKYAISKWISPFLSIGFGNRFKIILNARKHQGDINHITGDIHFVALGLKKQNTILTIHDLGFLNSTTNPLKKWFLKTFWVSLPIKKAQVVTVVSEATKAHLVQVVKVNPDKIRVISNFVSPQFKPTLKPFNEIPVVLLIGTAHNKNLQRCIHALKDIKCKIVLVGYPENELLKLLDSQANEFKVLNDLSENELIKCYNTCDFLLFASILEGFGLPIIEAQATGRPVITANLSSMPEVAGDGACLVDPYSVESIRTGILKVINNSEYRNSLIEKGFENVKRYSLEKVASQYAALYEEVYANQKK